MKLPSKFFRDAADYLTRHYPDCPNQIIEGLKQTAAEIDLHRNLEGPPITETSRSESESLSYGVRCTYCVRCGEFETACKCDLPLRSYSVRAARACECVFCYRLIMFEEEVWLLNDKPSLVFCSARCLVQSGE